MQAKYQSTCSACAGTIYPGDNIFSEDIGEGVRYFVHAECAHDVEGHLMPKNGDGFRGFGQQSRAGRTGVRMTLADKVKAGLR